MRLSCFVRTRPFLAKLSCFVWGETSLRGIPHGLVHTCLSVAPKVLPCLCWASARVLSWLVELCWEDMTLPVRAVKGHLI